MAQKPKANAIKGKQRIAIISVRISLILQQSVDFKTQTTTMIGLMKLSTKKKMGMRITIMKIMTRMQKRHFVTMFDIEIKFDSELRNNKKNYCLILSIDHIIHVFSVFL